MKIPKNYVQKIVYNKGDYICYFDTTTNGYLLYSQAEDRIIGRSKDPRKFDDKVFKEK